MSGSVVFVWDEFNSFYPELNATENKALLAFNQACLMLNNTSRSIITCVEDRKTLLYLLTAHILFLQNRGAGNVGSLSNAHEGSTSIGFSSMGKLNQSYFGQTQYGLLFCQLVGKYLSGFYVSEC